MNLLLKHISEFENIQSLKGKPIALWGAGRTAPRVYDHLKTEGHHVVCFIDNHPKKQGQKLCDLPVVSMTDPALREVCAILLTPRGIDRGLLNEMDCGKPAMTFDSYFVLQHAAFFENLYERILQDKRSKDTLTGILAAILDGNLRQYARIYEPNQYYCIPEFMLKQNEYLAEAGAFVGDSLERFIWNYQEFKTVYAFEPAKRQYNALVTRVKRLKAEWALEDDQIVTVNAGVGETTRKATIQTATRFSNFTVSSSDASDGEGLDIVSFDDYFRNTPVSFLKADIEGDEMAMLRGAKTVIQTRLPKIAICAYHNISDFHDIVQYVSGLAPGRYSFALRHHAYNFTETVLYCWPSGGCL